MDGVLECGAVHMYPPNPSSPCCPAEVVQPTRVGPVSGARQRQPSSDREEEQTDRRRERDRQAHELGARSAAAAHQLYS